ncbi:hypothetical protein BGZ52_000754 [Haplosporangium bisporale]|nr:hypothetical protein BGZ52_000754 [Haplosporangium bisporale]
MCAGLVTTGIFLLTKFLILRHDDSLRRGLIAIAFYFAITIFINVFYIIFKGSPGLNLSKLPIGSILGISFCVAGAVFLWCFFFMRPYLKRKLENDEPLRCHRESQETLGVVNRGLAALDDTPKKSRAVPTWILAYGGIVIDIGLLTYGYKVMATLGNNITYMSPSRGFSVSLGTSLTVLTCSKLGLPVITTHCITGATTAVGLCSGGGRKVEYVGQLEDSRSGRKQLDLDTPGRRFGLWTVIIYSPHKV